MYQAQLYNIYDTVAFENTEDSNHFFNKLDSCILWIEGIKRSLLPQKNGEITIIFWEAINILYPEDNNSCNLSKVVDLQGQYILNSMAANHTRIGETREAIRILNHIFKIQDNSPLKESNLYLICINNICEQYMDIQEYGKVIEYSSKGIDYLKSIHKFSFLHEFILFNSVANYLLYKTNKDKIRSAIDAIELSGKEEVAAIIRINLREQYHIEL